MGLDEWRRFLWAQALGQQYNKHADEAYKSWLHLRFTHLAVPSSVRKLLLELRQHYSIGLITNGTSRAQWEKISRLHLEKLFDIILVSGDLEWEKPHCRIFQQACDTLSVSPEECIMVGDKLETDILGGVEANLGGTVWVPLKKMEMVDIRADFVLEKVTDLMRILPKRGIEDPDLNDGNSNGSDGG